MAFHAFFTLAFRRLRYLWRQLIIQDICYERCKQSIYPLLTLAGTIVTQFALGSVYTWSLFNSSLSAKLDEPVSQVAFSFGLLSLGLALSSSVAGKLQERFGVRRVTMASGVLLGSAFSLPPTPTA
ncbi:Inner membrane protein yhjX [Raoultella planticola]|uniref:Inner membrane protein yhjX n=1 Tax=Raoultella planticola TaxID=575 RepID=A0A485BMH4_RAOPL|nr:Inner membrane protein yhjX [Raoultella planticola]